MLSEYCCAYILLECLIYVWYHVIPVWVAHCASCLHRAADDKFRANFLWGRRPMLAACAARLRERNDLVWVDLGAGTGVSG